MTTRLFSRHARRAASGPGALISLLCVLLLTGCGTSRESTNSYKQSVSAVDETGAAQTLKTIAAAEMSFIAGHGEYGSFEDLTAGGQLDSRFAGRPPEMSGYVYTIKLRPSSNGEAPMYAAYADPKTPASGVQTTGRHLYIDSTSSVIHANSSQQAAASDPAFP
jgi:hypothetical protein